jgi:hypothetical protein
VLAASAAAIGTIVVIGRRKKILAAYRSQLADAIITQDNALIRDLRAGAKSFGARALKNHEVRFRERALQRCIQHFHHSNIENVERRAVQCDPNRAAFYPNRNRFAGVSHNRGKSRVKEFICPEIWEHAARRRPESLPCNLRRDSI